MLKIASFFNSLTSLYGRASEGLTLFFRFTLSSSLSFVFDFTLLWLLTDIFKIQYLVSAVLAFILPATLNYWINRVWTFPLTERKFITGYIFFIAIAASDLILIVGLLALFVETFHLHYLWARFLVGLIVGLWNYFINTYFNFKAHLIPKQKVGTREDALVTFSQGKY